MYIPSLKLTAEFAPFQVKGRWVSLKFLGQFLSEPSVLQLEKTTQAPKAKAMSILIPSGVKAPKAKTLEDPSLYSYGPMDGFFRWNGGDLSIDLLQIITINLNNVAWVVKLDHFPQVVGVKQTNYDQLSTT